MQNPRLQPNDLHNGWNPGQENQNNLNYNGFQQTEMYQSSRSYKRTLVTHQTVQNVQSRYSVIASNGQNAIRKDDQRASAHVAMNDQKILVGLPTSAYLEQEQKYYERNSAEYHINSQTPHYRSNSHIKLDRSRMTQQDAYKHHNRLTETEDQHAPINGNGLHNDGRNSVVYRPVSYIYSVPINQQPGILQQNNLPIQTQLTRYQTHQSNLLINSYQTQLMSQNINTYVKQNDYPQYIEQDIERPKYSKLYTNTAQLYRSLGPQEDPVMKKTFCGPFCWVLWGLLGLIAAVVGVLLGLGLLGGLGFGGFGGTSMASPGISQPTIVPPVVPNITEPTQNITTPPIVEPPTIVIPPIIIPTLPVISPPQNITTPIVPVIPTTPPQQNITVIPVIPIVPIITAQGPTYIDAIPIAPITIPISVTIGQVPNFIDPEPIASIQIITYQNIPSIQTIPSIVPSTIQPSAIQSIFFIQPQMIEPIYFTEPVAVPQIFPEIVNPWIDPQPIAQIILPQTMQLEVVPSFEQPFPTPDIMQPRTIPEVISPQPFQPDSATIPSQPIPPNIEQTINPTPITNPTQKINLEPEISPSKTYIKEITPSIPLNVVIEQNILDDLHSFASQAENQISSPSS